LVHAHTFPKGMRRGVDWLHGIIPTTPVNPSRWEDLFNFVSPNRKRSKMPLPNGTAIYLDNLFFCWRGSATSPSPWPRPLRSGKTTKLDSHRVGDSRCGSSTNLMVEYFPPPGESAHLDQTGVRRTHPRCVPPIFAVTILHAGRGHHKGVVRENGGDKLLLAELTKDWPSSIIFNVG
jgi:hypothetical protein